MPRLQKVIFLIIFLLSFTNKTEAATIDGKFLDWASIKGVEDTQENYPTYDIAIIKWEANTEKIDFYVRRFNDGKSYFYGRILCDVNDNGNFQDNEDKIIYTTYSPASAQVSVYVANSQGNIFKSYSGKWGEKAQLGGNEYEFYVLLNDLGILPGQAIRFYCEGSNSSSYVNIDRCPEEGVIQVVPFPTWPWLWLIIGPLLIYGKEGGMFCDNLHSNSKFNFNNNRNHSFL